MRDDVERILATAKGATPEEMLAANTEGQSSALGRVAGYSKLTTDLDIEELLERFPNLHDHGFADPRETEPRRTAHLTGVEGRALINYIRTLLPVTVKPVKTVTMKSPGSYTAKHIFERAIGTYVSNGQMIAAVLLEPVIPVKLDVPNLRMGVARRQYDWLQAVTS